MSITLRHAAACYQAPDGEVEAVRDVSFTVEEGAFDVSGTSAAPSVSYGEHITETAAPKSEDSGTKVSFWVWAALVIIAALALAAVVTLSMRSAAERRRRKYRH